MCRYVVRPPVAAGRLRFVGPETLRFTLKTPWADGTTSLMLSPTELIEKLAALVPPPRLNLIRYHGVLAPAAADRSQIVPGPRSLTEASVSGRGDQATPEAPPRRHRVEWARLLARVFQVDVTTCDACGGHMKVIAALTDPSAIRKSPRPFLPPISATSNSTRRHKKRPGPCPPVRRADPPVSVAADPSAWACRPSSSEPKNAVATPAKRHAAPGIKDKGHIRA